MSKRAEKAALKSYPQSRKFTQSQRIIFNDMRDGFKFGYEQAEAETIERACKWLFAHLPILVDYYNEDIYEQADRSEFIKLFRKQMEEE